MDLGVLADKARRNDCNARDIEVLGVVVALEHVGVRFEEGFHKATVEPARNGCGLKLAALFNHHLEGVGQLEFTLRADVVIHELLEGRLQGLHVLDIVDADNGLVRDEFLRLLDKAADVAVFTHYGHAKTLRVFDLVRV